MRRALRGCGQDAGLDFDAVGAAPPSLFAPDYRVLLPSWVAGPTICPSVFPAASIAWPSCLPAKRPPRAKLIPGRAESLRSAESNPRTSPPVHRGPKHHRRQVGSGDEDKACRDDHYIPICGQCGFARWTGVCCREGTA